MRQEPITGQGSTIDQLEDKIRPLVNAERADKEVPPPSDQKKYYLFNIINDFDIVKPKSEVPKSKVPKSRPKGLGLTQ